MKLSILIVNWNTRELVIKCVDSILSAAPAFEFEIIVVDNASRDGSASALREKFGNEKRVKIVSADQNLGFARGVNLAYKNSAGEFILLLNPDTEAKTGSLAELVNYLQAHPDAEIVGGKILNPDGTVQPSVRRFPDLWSSFLVFTGLQYVIRPRKYLMDGFDYAKESEVDQVMGAVLLTRRSTIEKLGFLDENFWLWYEEVDFCYRVKHEGGPDAAVGAGKVVYYPEAVFVHHGGKSFAQLPVWKRKLILARSLAYYFKKRWSKKR